MKISEFGIGLSDGQTVHRSELTVRGRAILDLLHLFREEALTEIGKEIVDALPEGIVIPDEDRGVVRPCGGFSGHDNCKYVPGASLAELAGEFVPYGRL